MGTHNWLYTKKRGRRRTVTRLSGVVGEALFSLLFLFAGLLGSAFIFMVFMLPQMRVYDQYEEIRCLVEETQISQKKEGHSQKPHYRPEVQVSYEVGRNLMRSWATEARGVSGGGYYETREEAEKQLTGIVTGETRICWYDPQAPDNVIFTHSSTVMNWVVLLIPLSLVFIGGGTLLHLMLVTQLGSKEYSRVAAQRVSSFTSFGSGERRNSLLPYVPDSVDTTESAGVHLAYRLPCQNSRGWTLVISTMVCILINLFVVAQTSLVLNNLSSSNSEWTRLFFITPFALSGIVLIIWVVKQMREATIIGPTILEIEHFPIRPGDTCKLYLSQGGRLKMNWYNVMLVCHEEVIFTHGTNTRRETQPIYQRQLFCEEQFEISGKGLFEKEFRMSIPVRAMHSFSAQHNQVCWKIIIQASPDGLPVFERVFTLVVYPNEIPEETEKELAFRTEAIQKKGGWYEDMQEDTPLTPFNIWLRDLWIYVCGTESGYPQDRVPSLKWLREKKYHQVASSDRSERTRSSHKKKKSKKKVKK